VAAPAIALFIGLQHRAWQRPMHEALLGAERIAAERGDSTLGSTGSALKVALMHRGPVTVAGLGLAPPAVVLCSLNDGSYRHSGATRCDLPGYDVREAHGPFQILVAR
jgi:hypothetical protein